MIVFTTEVGGHKGTVAKGAYPKFFWSAFLAVLLFWEVHCKGLGLRILTFNSNKAKGITTVYCSDLLVPNVKRKVRKISSAATPATLGAKELGCRFES